MLLVLGDGLYGDMHRQHCSSLIAYLQKKTEATNVKNIKLVMFDRWFYQLLFIKRNILLVKILHLSPKFILSYNLAVI